MSISYVETYVQAGVVELKLKDNKFLYNVGGRGGPLYIDDVMENIVIENSLFWNNLVLYGLSTLTIEVDELSPKNTYIKFISTTFINCYGTTIGCIYGSSSLESNVILEFNGLNLTISNTNWLTEYVQYYENKSLIWPPSFLPNEELNECRLVPVRYFKWDHISTNIKDFRFENNILQINSNCLQGGQLFKSIFVYYKVNVATFGRMTNDLFNLKANTKNEDILDSITNMSYQADTCTYDVNQINSIDFSI